MGGLSEKMWGGSKIGANIHSITLGFDHCYIIRDKGIIMLDGGAPNKANEFAKALKKISIKPEDIQLIVLTQGHWDHIGSAKEIKELELLSLLADQPVYRKKSIHSA